MTLLRVFRNECARLAREESGVAVVFTLCSFLFLFACCTSVWFVGENVRRKAELQNACDAAAYSAAVVQADGLSRMAVVNRAMSWCYVQMTKMQMDYITLRWLELTKERFEKDRRNGDRTALLRMFSDKAGFHSLSREWRSWYMIIPRMILEIIGIHIYLGVENVDFWFAADCKDKTHRHEHDSGGNGSYIGFRLTQSDNSKIGCVRVNSSSRDAIVLDRYVEKTRIDEAVEDLQVMYGEKGWRLEALIGALKNAIITCNALLPVINRQMAVAIEETAVRTLQENLPRAPDGRIDQKLVDSYRWTVAGGVSRPPTQYATGMVGGVLEGVSPILNFVSHPYFSGLCNTEEDELAFLNMADGVPDHTGEVKLIDYFADNEKRSWKRTPAAGLDQWFIRCDPRESAISDQVQVVRAFTNAPAGIVRAYKNANYREGASATSALQKLIGMKGIHRGNYVTDILDGGTIDSAVSGLSGIFGFRPSKLINPGSKPKNPFKRIKWRAKRTLQKALRKLDGPIEAFMAPIQNTIGKIAGIAKTLEQAAFGVGVDPSCNNERLRFIDKCANVPDSTGLVSEWEWASAYWFCNWGRLRATGIVNFDVRWCMHPFLPVAAIHGGRSDAKPNVLLHSAGDTGGYGGTDRYGAKWKNYLFGLFGKVFPWFSEEVKMYSKQGHSRDKYRSSFVGLDGDLPSFKWCGAGHNTIPFVGYGGLHSNYLLKGFSRVYGDDKAVYNGYYQGVPCQPWVLNRHFFEGGGTIVVGVARKQSNFFADLFDDLARKAEILDRRSLYSAFTPADERQNFVALAAGRAGWAPRRGYGRADGADSVNAGANPARVYEVRYDSVTDRKFGPQGHPVLPENVPGVSSADLELLQKHGRIGCACGHHNTTARLRRQWNLSQTDWDGVLLPLRYAHAKPAAYDSGPPVQDAGGEWRGGDGADAKTDWLFSVLGSFTPDDASASVAGMLWDHAVWRKFGETELGGGWFSKSNEGSSMKTKDVLPLPVDVDDRTPADLIRKRRIL